MTNIITMVYKYVNLGENIQTIYDKPTHYPKKPHFQNLCGVSYGFPLYTIDFVIATYMPCYITHTKACFFSLKTIQFIHYNLHTIKKWEHIIRQYCIEIMVGGT